MKKNSRHTVKITGVTEKGFGVAEVQGMVVFIDGALPDETIEIQIVKTKKTYAYGKIIEIITPSPNRVPSICPVSHICGGCQFAHCDYQAQLSIKKKIVSDALERIGGIPNPPVFDVIGMDNPLRYRNKAVFPITPDGIGMYAPRSHRLIKISDCKIQHPAHIPILAALKAFIARHNIAPYCEETHTGLLRNIVIRTTMGGEIMVILVINGTSIPHINHLAEALADLNVTSLLTNPHTTRNNNIFGEDFTPIFGDTTITETLDDIQYKISAPSFFQVNPVQAEALYATALTQAALDKTQTAIDAHCGAGGIALHAAKQARHIIGTDISAAAIKNAKENAVLNGIENIDFITGTAEETLPSIMRQRIPDTVFLDPPRKGCEPELLNTLIAAKIKRIVYISCNPATLARDIKTLTQGGYILKEARPVDMFPFTGKVETTVLLQQKCGENPI